MRLRLAIGLTVFIVLAAGLRLASIPLAGPSGVRGEAADTTAPHVTPSGAAASVRSPSDGAPAGLPRRVPGCVQVGRSIAASDVAFLPAGMIEDPDVLVYEGLCDVIAGPAPFALTFAFPPGTAEEAIRASLRVEGEDPRLAEFGATSPQGWPHLLVLLGPASPGDETTVRIAGPVGPDGAHADLGFRIVREEHPTVTVEVKQGDGPWRLHAPGEYLPREPLRLRLSFSHPVERQWVDRLMPEALPPEFRNALPYEATWIDPQTWELHLPEPPPLLRMELRGRDQRGLWIQAGAVHLRTGEPPRLVALDPVTGAETDLGPAPVDIYHWNTSPDGRWVAAEAMRPEDAWDMEVWVIDLLSGEAHRTGMTPPRYFDGYYWLADRLMVPGRNGIQEWDLARRTLKTYESSALYPGPLSPDGRYLPGFRIDYGRADYDSWYAPIDVLVYDLATRTERDYPDAGTTRIAGKDGEPPRLVFAWSEDGLQLYVQRGERWEVLDEQDGILRPAEVEPPPPSFRGCCDPVPGPAGWAFAPHWSDDIVLRSPEGEEVRVGAGAPLAWRPDGQLLVIRWAEFRYRRVPVR